MANILDERKKVTNMTKEILVRPKASSCLIITLLFYLYSFNTLWGLSHGCNIKMKPH
jgi:hypothetical protein